MTYCIRDTRPGDVGEAEDAALVAARGVFPSVHFFELAGGGYLVVPRGTRLTRALTLGGLIATLTAEECDHPRYVTVCKLCGVRPEFAAKSACGHPGWESVCAVCSTKKS